MEPPGIAPGSGPLITGAFIAIVRANPDTPNIGHRPGGSKGFPPAPRRHPAGAARDDQWMCWMRQPSA